MSKVTNLFEYGQWEEVANRAHLEQMLNGVWQNSAAYGSVDEDEEADPNKQPYLKFDGQKIKARNYVGFIQNSDEVIEIYPKVFFSNKEEALEKKDVMLSNVLYWFSYCRKWRFPYSKATLDIRNIENFPELIIRLIANQFLETISKQPLVRYQQLEEALDTPRGAINFKRYVANSLTYANYHKIECDYEPFLFDNKVNRIIKYCTRLLIDQARFSESQRLLQEVIFILDEVEDHVCTVHDVERVEFNPFFDDYSDLMDSCRIILNQTIYSNNAYDFSQWCLLFPMEKIFEDFLAGFIEQNFKDVWIVEPQKSELFLSEEPNKAFQMQHDIFLTSKDGHGKKVIVDAKYKLRDVKKDGKEGVSQSDLYQMVSYAYRRGCTDVLLVYPSLIDSGEDKPAEFKIFSGFSGNEKISVRAIGIPFWTLNSFGKETLDKRLKEVIGNNLKEILGATNYY